MSDARSRRAATENADEVVGRLVACFLGPEPLPAGGAAGVLAIAMGTAVGAKILRLSGALGPSAELETSLRGLLPGFRNDCTSFESVLAALRLPRRDPARSGNLRDAWKEATEASVDTARRAHQVHALLAEHAGEVKRSMKGDIDASLRLVRAGIAIAESNARENASHLDHSLARELLRGLSIESSNGDSDA